MKRGSLKFAFLVVFGLVLFLSGAVNAQGRRFDVDSRVNELKTKLTLTDKQTEDVKKILVASQEAAAKEREQSGGDFEARRKARLARFQETDKKVMALLTDKQKEEYKKIIQEREQRMNNR